LCFMRYEGSLKALIFVNDAVSGQFRCETIRRALQQHHSARRLHNPALSGIKQMWLVIYNMPAESSLLGISAIAELTVRLFPGTDRDCMESSVMPEKINSPVLKLHWCEIINSCINRERKGVSKSVRFKVHS
jgi:hypothetical protein